MKAKDKPADPIAIANAAFWRQVETDAEYRNWMRRRTADLIEICEWPEQVEHLKSIAEKLRGNDDVRKMRQEGRQGNEPGSMHEQSADS